MTNTEDWRSSTKVGTRLYNGTVKIGEAPEGVMGRSAYSRGNYMATKIENSMATKWRPNTNFFHLSTIIQRKKKRIEALLSSGGERIMDQSILKDTVVAYFK